MKNKGLIIGGGLAIVALGAFLWMRKKNQMAEEDASVTDGKSNTSTALNNATTNALANANTGTNTGAGKLGGRPSTQTTPTNSTSSDSSDKQTKGLLSKNIYNAERLQGTPLGLEISFPLLNSSQKFKLKTTILTMSNGEKAVLNYIAVVDATTRNSEAFKTALASTLGSQAPALIDVVYNKILTASTFGATANSSVPADTSSSQPSYQECVRQAIASGIKPYQLNRIADYVRSCRGNGFDGSYSFNMDGFESDCEDFAFNGHTF